VSHLAPAHAKLGNVSGKGRNVQYANKVSRVPCEPYRLDKGRGAQEFTLEVAGGAIGGAKKVSQEWERLA
jgi:hypothetical protein